MSLLLGSSPPADGKQAWKAFHIEPVTNTRRQQRLRRHLGAPARMPCSRQQAHLHLTHITGYGIPGTVVYGVALPLPCHSVMAAAAAAVAQQWADAPCCGVLRSVCRGVLLLASAPGSPSPASCAVTPGAFH